MKIAWFGKVILNYLINKVKTVKLVTARRLVDKICKNQIIYNFILKMLWSFLSLPFDKFDCTYYVWCLINGCFCEDLY